MDALKVEGIWKNFGGLQVLQDVSFSLKKGEHLALIGPNGAGKTTLINVLSGVLPPSRGGVFFLGHDVTKQPVPKRLHLGMACSFQINNLFFNLNVLDNILLALHGKQPFHLQLSHSIDEDDPRFIRVQRLMDTMGLWEKRHLPITSLSYGEQRMMEIALSLASDPKLLLLDEPSAGLSEGETTRMIGFIRNLPEETAVLFVSHDMDIVFDLADRIMVLSYGVLIAEGKPEEIHGNSKVKEIYLGDEESV